MLKILEDDAAVGAVGGDVQVTHEEFFEGSEPAL